MQIGISLCSYIGGAGKDTVADFLVDNHGFKKYAFSDGIYEIAEKYFGMKAKDRNLLIRIGELLREIDPMLWINYTIKRIREDGHNRVVVTDTRKVLEMAYLEEFGFQNVMIYCDPKVAIKRVKDRDGEADEDLIMNGKTENQLRIFKDVIKTIDNTDDFEETAKELDALVNFLNDIKG